MLVDYNKCKNTKGELTYLFTKSSRKYKVRNYYSAF